MCTVYSELDLFRGLSFDTISSAGPNGGTFSFDSGTLPLLKIVLLPAIIHYKPDPADCAIIRKDQVCWLSE